MKFFSDKIRNIIVHHVLHADDTPEQIARGVGIASIITFLPLVGIQTILSLGIAALTRANKAICLPIVWITNPVTVIPIYGGCLALGRFVIKLFGGRVSDADVVGQLKEFSSFSAMFDLEKWKQFISWSMGMGAELWLGCLIVGLATAIPGYIITLKLVHTYRSKNKLLLEKIRIRKLRSLKRSKRSVSKDPV